jgi:hypothetical protein
VQCSDQAPVVPKAAATYKHWSQESKVYALEVGGVPWKCSTRSKPVHASWRAPARGRGHGRLQALFMPVFAFFLDRAAL